MVYFKELLPNPVGKDTDGEWIKLINIGEETVNISLISKFNIITPIKAPIMPDSFPKSLPLSS